MGTVRAKQGLAIAVVILAGGMLAIALLASRTAAADHPPPATDKVQGFVAPGRGELGGRVVDSRGNPVKHAVVHVVTKDGERTVTTDGDGCYKLTVGERSTLVFVHGDASISGSTVTSAVVDDHEANLSGLRAFLQRDYSVMTTTSGNEAIRIDGLF